MDAETGFLIEDTHYEVPTVDTLTMDEARVLYDYAKVVQEDFALQDGETEGERSERVGEMFRNPSLWLALAHIAYQRGNPTKQPDRVAAIVKNLDRLELMKDLAEQAGEADQPDPPALTTEPDGSSPNGPVESNENTGRASTNGSDEQVEPPTPIGIGRSATSSPESPATMSAG